MTVVLTLDEPVTTLDRVIDMSELKQLIVIVREPAPERVSTPDARMFTFDDDDLVTWEDAEWQ